MLTARAFPAGDGARLRCGIVRAPFWDDLDPEVEARCREAVAAGGWEIVELSLDRVELSGPAAASRLAPELLAGLDLSVLRRTRPGDPCADASSRC